MGGLEDGDSNPAKAIETMFVFFIVDVNMLNRVPGRPLNAIKYSYMVLQREDHYFSRDLLNHQFQGTIFLMVGLTSVVKIHPF